MKRDLLRLIDKVDEVSTLFHITSGVGIPSVNEISDVEEFIVWKREIQFELEEICKKKKDSFIGDALTTIKEGFNGWNDEQSFQELKGFLLTIKRNVDTYFSSEGFDALVKEEIIPMSQEKSGKIFISHSSKDVKYVEVIVDLLVRMGVPNDKIFCSSVPGYDIPVGKTIFEFLKEQFLNYPLHVLFIHSSNYYRSAVSLNEMGAAWALRRNYTSILLPGFSYDKMVGVVNNQDIAIKLDNQNVLELKDKLNQLKDNLALELGFEGSHGIIWERSRDAFIDTVCQISAQEKVDQPTTDAQIQQEAQNRGYIFQAQSGFETEVTTDDERIILYYILSKQARKVSKDSLQKWLHENEIYGVDIDNGFDLLASFEGGAIVDDTLNLSINMFREYSANSDALIAEMHPYIKNHTKYASDTFKELWYHSTIDDNFMLFISYIMDERMTTFGDRWMAKTQIANIQQWENKNELDSTLSSNYGSCLELFIQHDLVYESSWTSYGNPREYSLCPSLRNLLFSAKNACQAKVATVRKRHKELPLPF